MIFQLKSSYQHTVCRTWVVENASRALELKYKMYINISGVGIGSKLLFFLFTKYYSYMFISVKFYLIKPTVSS